MSTNLLKTTTDGTIDVFYYDSTSPIVDDSLNWINWYPQYGMSWGYYVNSGDYKIEYEDNKIIVDVLVAGLDKKDIEASLENESLKVTSSKPGWNGNVNVDINLSSYKVDFKKVTVKLINGVLRVEFNKKDEKIKLKIE